MKPISIIRTLALGLISLALSTNLVNGQQTSRYDDPPAKTTKTTKNENYFYKNAFGVRAGQTSGITYKHITPFNNGVEIIGGIYPFAVSLTGLYEHYIPTGLHGLQFYLGGGGHLASRLNRYSYRPYGESGYYDRSYYSGPAVGIDGIMGIEFKVPRAPFAFSFDLKPNIELVPGSAVYGNMDPGLGIKVAF